MTELPKPPTHTAYIFRREGKQRRMGRWLECGVGRVEKSGAINVFLDRTPVGGFSGHVYLAAIGTQPPVPEPERPGQRDGDEELEE
jgi:hypothetical protein